MKYIAAGAIRKRLGRSKSTNFRGRFKMTPRRAICNLLCLISSLAALMVKRRANCAMLGSETLDFPDKNVMELVCSASSDTAAGLYTCCWSSAGGIEHLTSACWSLLYRPVSYCCRARRQFISHCAVQWETGSQHLIDRVYSSRFVFRYDAARRRTSNNYRCQTESF